MLAGNASAAPPTLLSVGHDARHPTATWSSPPTVEAAVVEVATNPATASGGNFHAANVVDSEGLVGGAQRSWRSLDALQRGGTFYVHVGGVDYACAACVDIEWSNILSFHLTPPRPLVIRGDMSLAGFRVRPSGRLSRAIRALGQPSARTYLWSGEGCRVGWRDVGARMVFYNLGGDDACSGRWGYFSSADLTGRRWRTSKGLAIGDPVSKLRRLYPNARFRRSTFYGNGWWLVPRGTIYGSGGTYPGLLATVHGGRVTKFKVTYPAGGD